MDFKFVVHPWGRWLPREALSTAFLVTNDWDDFGFATLFSLIIIDDKGERYEIGDVKIGAIGMAKEPELRKPNPPKDFVRLESPFFSLGQNDSYYENLNALGAEIRDIVLECLRDIAAEPTIFDEAIHEDVTKVSLLRDVTPMTVQGQFRRLAWGGAKLSRYQFSYRPPKGGKGGTPPVDLSFEVRPASNPPTNIHVLIGRNGVGKTRLLHHMTRALVDEESTQAQVGAFFVRNEPVSETELFANLVSVTFSAFDPFDPLPERRDRTDGIKYSYVGLKRSSNTGKGLGTPKSPEMLEREFAKSVRTCLNGARAGRWRRAIVMLETDPIFKEADVYSLVEQSIDSPLINQNESSGNDGEFEKRAAAVFRRFSSGHKIVLLTITKLVETVEERTLGLIDEPEAHLHPPLLSAFVRALSDLLVDRNGVGIIATHSPVVLQEVPKNCAWKLRRTGNVFVAERPEMETFGENVGVLTREAFGLEVTQAGYHQLLRDAIRREGDYNSVIESFNNELGAEAKAIIRALIGAQSTDQLI